MSPTITKEDALKTLVSVEVSKITKLAQADKILAIVSESGLVEVPVLTKLAEKKEFIKELIIKASDGDFGDLPQVDPSLNQDDDSNDSEENTTPKEPTEPSKSELRRKAELQKQKDLEDAKNTEPSKSELRRKAELQKQKDLEDAKNVEAPATHKTYNGIIIVNESNTILNGKTYKQIQCADGQIYRLTKEEYEASVR